MPLIESKLAAMKKACEKATQGKWSWNVNLRSKEIRLESDGARQIVIDFARWGTGKASPRFNRDGIMERADAFAQQVEGREHHAAWHQTVDHPDANFIALCSPANIAELIAEVERLQEQWNTRFNVLCGNCGKRYRGPRDEAQHGLGVCEHQGRRQ